MLAGGIFWNLKNMGGFLDHSANRVVLLGEANEIDTRLKGQNGPEETWRIARGNFEIRYTALLKIIAAISQGRVPLNDAATALRDLNQSLDAAMKPLRDLDLILPEKEPQVHSL